MLLLLRRLTARVRRVESERAGLKQAVVTAVSPLQVSISGGSAVRAMAADGVELAVSDRVSVLVQDTDVLVLGRNTDDPQDAGAGSGGPPTGSAGGDLSGTYPNPQIGSGVIVNADVSGSAAIDQSKVSGLVSDLALKAPLASPALTGNPTAPTQTAGNNSTRVATTAYADGAVSTASTADRARSNHTGTQTASTISDFDTQVRTSRLDQMTAPGANVPMNTKKLTGLLQGSVAGDSAEYSQMIAGDAAAQLGFTLKGAVNAVSIAALPAHSRSGDVLTASANGLLAPSFGTLKFSWTSGSNGTGNGQFKAPFDMALDSSGNIFVADRDNNRVQKFNSSGVYQSKFNAGGAPVGIAIDASNNIWVVADTQLYKYNSSGVPQGSVIVNGTLAAPLGGIAIDSSGNIFLTVQRSSGFSTVYEVQKFNSSLVYQSAFGSAGTGNGQFDTPSAIAIDASNNIWVADTNNNRIQKFNSSGTYQSQFGAAGLADGSFYSPTGIEIDSSSNIWVADYGNNRIQKFNSSGTFQAKYGSAGTGNGQFIGPRGLQVTSTGDLLATDEFNNRIQKFTAFSLAANDTVLVRHEGSGTHIENTIYTVTNPGSVSTQWVLTLRSDMATGYAKNQSMVIALTEDGAQNRVFTLNTADPITVWTTALTWSRFEPGGPPSLHALTHAPGGPDPILTGIPVAVGAANSEGTADSFARSDHNHALPNWGTFYAAEYMSAPASATVLANRTYFAAVRILTAATITGIQFSPLSATGTCRVSMYDSTGARVANRTTDSSALAASVTQVAFSSTYAASPGLYYIGITFSGTPNVTMADHHAANLPAGPGSNATVVTITPPTTAAQVPTMSTY